MINYVILTKRVILTIKEDFGAFFEKKIGSPGEN